MNKNKITLSQLIQIILHLLLNVHSMSEAGNLSSGPRVAKTPEQEETWLESAQRSDLQPCLETICMYTHTFHFMTL